MIIKDFRINAPSTGEFMNLYCIGDLHIGSPAFLNRAFDKICKISAEDDKAYFVLMGDVTDDDRPSTRILRRQMFNDRVEALEQEDMQHLTWLDTQVSPKLEKLMSSDRCLGILDGDHYRVYANGLTSVQYLCAKNKYPYLGQGQALLRLKVSYRGRTGSDTRIIRVHVHHGKGGGATEQADIRELQSIQHQWPNVDLFIRGHSHKPKAFPFSYYYDTSGVPPRICTGEGLLVNAGSFRQGVIMNRVDYAETRVYPPTSTRCPIVSFTASKSRDHNSHLEVNMSPKLTVQL